VLGGGHIPPLPFGVNGGIAPWELPLVMAEDPGLMPSAELLLGGVNRLPTLVRVVAAG
jgi:hypothetical protein